MFRLAFAAALLAAGVLAPQGAHAQKFAVIDVQKVMASIPAWTTAIESLKKDFEKKRAELQAREAELMKVKTQLDAKSTVTDPKTLRAETEAFQQKVMAFQKELQEAQQVISEREAELSKVMLGRVSRAAQELGAQGEYDYVLEVGDDRAPNVLYAAKGVNATDKVVDLYKKMFGDQAVTIPPRGAKAPAPKVP